MLFFAINIAILILYQFTSLKYVGSYSHIMIVSLIYTFFARTVLIIMITNVIILSGKKRAKFKDFFSYVKTNYKNILKIFTVYFFASLVLNIFKYIFKELLAQNYSMNEKSTLSILIDNSFSHLIILILGAIIFTSLSKKLSIIRTFTGALKLIKGNMIAFVSIFLTAIIAPHILINIVAVIIKLFDISPLELVQILTKFVTTIGWTVIEGKTSAGSFFVSLTLIINDLKFIFSLPFYILLMNYFNKKSLNLR